MEEILRSNRFSEVATGRRISECDRSEMDRVRKRISGKKKRAKDRNLRNNGTCWRGHRGKSSRGLKEVVKNLEGEQEENRKECFEKKRVWQAVSRGVRGQVT